MLDHMNTSEITIRPEYPDDELALNRLYGKPAPELAVSRWVDSPAINLSELRGKVVFIGTTAAGLHDIFQTPYGDAGAMPAAA